MSRQTCTEITPECPVSLTLYGYYPNLSVNAFFVALFGLLFVLQIAFGGLRRTWTFMIAAGIGLFGEAVGYGGRLLMHNNPWSGAGFKTQICCLVLAPSFLAAAVYVTLKHVVLYCGPEHSRLKPRLYPWVFIGMDFGSIVLQAIGGGVASAADSNTKDGAKLAHAGDGLIVAGIAFQVFTMAVCALLMADYFRSFLRAKKALRSSRAMDGVPGSEWGSEWEKNRSDPKVKKNFRLFCIAIAFAFVAIWIRCIYRVPEMAGGWGNPLMRKENEFLLLDGM